MSDNATPDPWDSLADALGAKPSGDPQPRPSSPPPPPRRRDQRPAAKKPAAAASGGDWDSLAADFGIAERAARESTARPAASRSEDSPPPAREPDRVESRRPPRERRAAFDDGVAAEPREPAETDRLDDGPTDERSTTSRGDDGEEGGEAGRRRRRRGRRGGRGRRREGDRAEATPRSRDDRSADRQPEDGGRDQERSRRPVARLPRPSEDVSEGDSWRDEIEDEFVEAGPGDGEGIDAAPAGRRAEADREDGERPRRRRGRRGGRGRARAQTSDEGSGSEPRREAAAAAGDHDDEPLPASYGSRPADRVPARPRAEAAAADGTEEAPRSRGRRRRRSRREGGEGRREGSEGRRTTSTDRREPATGERASQRRDRRRREDSSSSRGRRSDFAPVSGRYDEDDEGLEFLGVEEAAREPDARPRSPAEDDVLAESGLSGVLDVPSWVEAIGIVIAGNLAARSKSSRGDGKGR
jgi:ribonuclease E